MWDNHMHSSFSGDSEADPRDMIAAAKAKKLDGITFTDHLDLDYFEEPGVFDLDIDDYFSKQKDLALKSTTPDFTVLTGIEIGLMPSTAERNKAVIDSKPFDFVIGSTHVIDGKDPYYKPFWEGKDPDALIKRYYEVILENITAFPYFDTLGHLDYCFRYKPGFKGGDTYNANSELIDEILKKIISLDKALEVNTGAFIKGFQEPNPCSIIIKRYRELGGKLITIGADAHAPENVAIAFEKLPAILKDCGFNEFAVYKNRIPNLYPIK